MRIVWIDLLEYIVDVINDSEVEEAINTESGFRAPLEEKWNEGLGTGGSV